MLSPKRSILIWGAQGNFCVKHCRAGGGGVRREQDNTVREEGIGGGGVDRHQQQQQQQQRRRRRTELLSIPCAISSSNLNDGLRSNHVLLARPQTQRRKRQQAGPFLVHITYASFLSHSTKCFPARHRRRWRDARRGRRGARACKQR